MVGIEVKRGRVTELQLWQVVLKWGVGAVLLGVGYYSQRANRWKLSVLSYLLAVWVIVFWIV